MRYLCELTESAKFFNFREAQRRPRNPLPNIRVIYAVKVWIRLLYIDKGGRAADFTQMWVLAEPLSRNVQPIALSLFYNERPALQYNAK